MLTNVCIGLHYTSGLVKRKDIIGQFDSDVVALMKKAGGIMLAITNVPELCMWWESHNNVYGRSCNPYDTRRTVGGSSGGEVHIFTYNLNLIKPESLSIIRVLLYCHMLYVLLFQRLAFLLQADLLLALVLYFKAINSLDVVFAIILIFQGSDIGGSIRVPAFFTGIFGHKPTTG